MTRYWAGEDFPIGTEIESDDNEQAAERANERFGKAWAVMNEALLLHPELGVYLNDRYQDDLRVHNGDGELVYGDD